MLKHRILLNLNITFTTLVGFIQVLASYYFAIKNYPQVYFLIANIIGCFLVLGRSILQTIAENVKTNIDVNIGTPNIEQTTVTTQEEVK